MLRSILLTAATSVALLLVGCAQPTDRAENESTAPSPHSTSNTTPAAAMTDANDASTTPPAAGSTALETATFGAGCFWCVEAVLEQIEGVADVTSGYMGGSVENPTYQQVCTGTTGHAEVVQVHFDPSRLSFADLVDVFWDLHDPTTLNRQGADRGTQYRSAIFFHSPEQEATARASLAAAQARFEDPIVTEITPASTYYEAEDYHQDYYFANRDQPYCRAVISPKLKKLGLKH
ncbi:Peptide methionine sulfoxide reductase MsrA [Planctomycetes bacterium Pla163]|uniref:Peptide methionine sulfoxide reductase MsrA n=1 Tax=Rohdeia mirabilis TaxID=2528008 RepID=A0A518CZT3_9BACT|nr:Peptide methionine sulfoxide reductase MsrA [Planctomycetes bacterium Pla163]